ncbi:MAG: phosphate ABC transporter substrate-binding protein PstS [Candidatus Tectimicrobiota bacterium]
MMIRRLLTLLALLCLSSSGMACNDSSAQKPAPSGALLLQGAGATFPAPLYKKWLEEYQKRTATVRVSYDPVGSGEGTKRFLTGAVDFGASDAALSDEEIAGVPRGVQLLPVVAGSIVLAYNLDGLGGELKLKRDVYADIFLGQIKTWDDPRIKATNPGLQLPSATIALVARQDSSGTTFAFTNHLSAISEAWRNRGPGTGRVIGWPGNTMLAPGNEGVAGRIKLSHGSLGYVEYGMAQRTGLKMAWLENKAGQFIQPHGGSGLATLINTEMPANLRAFFPDPEGQESYPIVTYSWLLLYKKYDNPQKLAALKQYLTWCLTEGQALNESLGYIRLAPRVATQVMRALDQL